jgi:hypothetical protein
MAVWRMDVACWISKDTRAQAQSRTRALTSAHALNQARTHTQDYIIRAFHKQQWFRECVSMLGYMYIACIVVKIHIVLSSTGVNLLKIKQRGCFILPP